MQPCIAIVLALLSLCHAATGALEGYIDRDAAVGTIVRSRQYIDAGPLYLRREVNDAPLIVTSNDLEAERLVRVLTVLNLLYICSFIVRCIQQEPSCAEVQTS